MADLVFPGQAAGQPVLNSGAMPSNNDMVIYRGDYVELFVVLKDSSGTAIDVSTYTGKAQLKLNYADSAPINFVCTTTGNPGEFRVYLSSTTSATLVAGNYIWDFQVANGAGDIRTYLTGDVTVYEEVTT